MSNVLFGFDIGGTRIKAIVADASGKLLHSEYLATADATDAYKPAVASLHAALELRFGRAAAVGVSSPGLAAPDHSRIAWMRGRMAGVEGYNWGATLGRPVRVLNDAHAALYGEVWCGAARHARHAVMFTLGTGVGGAILCDGRVLTGHLGRAGHLGHLSLNPDGPRDIVNTPGSVEDLIGDHTVKSRSAGRFADTAALVTAANAGDAAAKSVWLASVRALAAAIASMINAVDPEIVVLGGGIARAGPALLQPLAEQMDLFEWRPTGTRVPIVLAELDDLAGAIGAAWFASTFLARENA